MKIINLIEDTEGNNGCIYEHGLSFYIETSGHKLLVDTGATDAFIKNAEQKGIDLAGVDTVILSHGHYDHTGGVLAFARLNPNAKIYVHKNAVGEFYNLKNTIPKYIGADKCIFDLKQVYQLSENTVIDDELSVFCGVTARRLWPKSNTSLKKKLGNDFVQDEFDHEQYIAVTEGEQRVLISGCAHNGILNILEEYKRIYGNEPTHVISGFHTVKNEYTNEDEYIILQIAKALSEMKTVFYSGHCTGEYALELMKSIMGDKLVVLHSGDDILSD